MNVQSFLSMGHRTEDNYLVSTELQEVGFSVVFLRTLITFLVVLLTNCVKGTITMEIS